MNPDSHAGQTVEILAYQPAYKSYFKTLNEAWIRKYFCLERDDQRLLDDPEGEMLEKGGFVFFARLNDEIVGTCGLTRNADGSFELVKMGVDEKAQGKKIGYRLAEAAIAKAREQGADQVVLHSATLLKPAIGLYRKLGFREVPRAENHYERCDIKMALSLSEEHIH
jgi:ribosomal protein S18 acetylase RimI-like enzyme